MRARIPNAEFRIPHFGECVHEFQIQNSTFREDSVGLLTDRVAIVTGASKGIGRVMSQVFASEGAKVVCAARSKALVEDTASRIQQAGGSAIAVVVDLTKEDEVRSLMLAAVKAFGRLECLVNNAGDGGPTKPVQEYSLDDWFDTINSCLT